eukprot:4112680-Prymnesium_polylepis.2
MLRRLEACTYCAVERRVSMALIFASGECRARFRFRFAIVPLTADASSVSRGGGVSLAAARAFPALPLAPCPLAWRLGLAVAPCPWPLPLALPLTPCPWTGRIYYCTKC